MNQTEEKKLNEWDQKRYQYITSTVMHLGQVSRYDTLFTVNQLSRAMPKPSKAPMRAAKQLLRYLAGSVNFSITYRRGGFKLTAYSDANWDNNPNNGKSTSLYMVMLTNGPISFKVGLQSLTAQFTVETELVTAALTMKKAVFCSNMMVELGFEKGFSSMLLYRDNTKTLHVVGKRIYFPRVKDIALGYFFV